MEGKCWKEWLPHPPDLTLFLLEGVAGLGPAAIGMAARCHPQLMLEVKAAQKRKRSWVEIRRRTPPFPPGSG